MKKRGSIGKKISLIVLVMVISSTAVIGAFSYTLYRRDSVAVSSDKARAIAETISSAIDGGQYRDILASGEKNDYWTQKKQDIDEVMARTDVAYLYLLDKNYSDTVTYFAEASPENDVNYDTIDLGETESIKVHADELFETLRTGEPTVTGIYSADEYGMMVSGFAAIFDENGAVTGVVGVDINIDDVLASSRFFGMIIIVCVVAFSAVFWLLCNRIIQRSVGKPIAALSHASAMLAKGDMDINLTVSSNDEIGALTEAFLEMTASTNRQIAVLERLAAGDLTAQIQPRSERDAMGLAIIHTLGSLNAMFGEIGAAATQVKVGSNQISDGSQTLAQGSSEQAAVVEQLSAAIAQITRQTDESALLAERAASFSETIRQNAEKGSHQMDQMMAAVQDITDAGQSISKVIGVIDSIAFQTNILALNAAVEAARAGQHGKGFAVVAEEVRSLAAKSAEAAKDTGGLITNSVEKADLGARIARETAVSLADIVTGINESNLLISDIAKSSSAQSQAIAQINMGVDKVSQVVQQNSAAAEESASASQEMSGQAVLLEELVTRFKLNNSGEYGHNQALRSAPALPPPRGKY